MSGQRTRSAPLQSAKTTILGCKLKGQDGEMYQCTLTSAGNHSWKKLSTVEKSSSKAKVTASSSGRGRRGAAKAKGGAGRGRGSSAASAGAGKAASGSARSGGGQGRSAKAADVDADDTFEMDELGQRHGRASALDDQYLSDENEHDSAEESDHRDDDAPAQDDRHYGSCGSPSRPSASYGAPRGRASRGTSSKSRGAAADQYDDASLMSALDSLDLGSAASSSGRRSKASKASASAASVRSELVDLGKPIKRRLAPQQHAADFEVGSRLRGMDGEWHVVSMRSDGSHRWKRETASGSSNRRAPSAHGDGGLDSWSM